VARGHRRRSHQFGLELRGVVDRDLEKPVTDEQSARLERGLSLLSALLLLLLIAVPIYLIPHHLPLNYNEGWNAYFAQAALRGEPLYPSSQAYLVNNYPPLSFFVVGLLGRLLGDDIIAGRLLSLASFILLGLGIFRLQRWIGARPGLAMLGTLQTMLAIYALRSSAMAMDDPQFLAQLLVIAGTLMLLAQIGRETIIGLVSSAVLIVAGGLVKHNVISLPIAVCVWLCLQQRRSALRFLPTLAAVGGLAVATLAAIWGHRVFDSVLRHDRIITLEVALARARFLVLYAIPYYALTVYACFRLRRQPAFWLVALYLLLATAVGFWMLSGEGTALNVLYDLVIALGLGTTAFVLCLQQDLDEKPNGVAAVAAAKLVLLIPIVVWVVFIQRGTTTRDLDLLAHEKDWTRLIRQLSQSTRPTACETLSLCYWAGQPAEIDFFNFGEKLRTGAMTDTDFRARIERGDYGYVEVEPTSPRLPTPTADWLASHYMIVDGIDNQALLLAPQDR
jgi:hypothetical protein